VEALQRYCFTPLSTDATFRESCPKLLTGNELAMMKAHYIGVGTDTVPIILWLNAPLVKQTLNL